MKAKVLDKPTLLISQRELIGKIVDVEHDGGFVGSQKTYGGVFQNYFMESELEFLPDTDPFLEWVDGGLSGVGLCMSGREAFMLVREKYLELKEE